MGLSSFTKYFRYKSSDDYSSKSSSRASTPTNSRPESLISNDNILMPSNPSNKYLSDPMRSSDDPDYVGGFYDPISISRHYLQSTDCTNTGA